MNSNDVIRDTRVAHVRELKAEIARLKSELSDALDELGAWRAHFDLAVLAARDAAAVPPVSTQSIPFVSFVFFDVQ